jgi:hypothetical protein
MRIEVIDECAMVDELAALKAQLAPLLEREEVLKDYFKNAGRERYYGTEHEAVIILSERHTPDTKRLKAYFGFDKDGNSLFTRDWCNKSDSISCKLTGRKLSR